MAKSRPVFDGAKLALDGGVPVRTIPWPTYDNGAVCVDDNDCFAASRVIKSKLLYRYDFRDIDDTEAGRLENELAKFFNVKYSLAVSSGTTALSLSMMACGIGVGDEVLCSSFGFPASPSSIILTGAKPVLVEVDENLHMDIDDVKKKINPLTKAILMIHMRGQAGDIEQVVQIAEENGIPLIEDAVPVLGLKIGDKHLGTFGIVGAFSTQSDKSMNTGEGGFILTDDREIFERAIVLCGAYEGRLERHCKGWKSTINQYALPLYNFRMDEIRAAVARTQLKKVPGRLNVMKENYARACSIIEASPQLRIREPVWVILFYFRLMATMLTRRSGSPTHSTLRVSSADPSPI